MTSGTVYGGPTMSNRCCLKLQRAGVVRHCNIRRPDLRAPGTALLSVPAVFYFCEHKSNNAEIVARRGGREDWRRWMMSPALRRKCRAQSPQFSRRVGDVWRYSEDPTITSHISISNGNKWHLNRLSPEIGSTSCLCLHWWRFVISQIHPDDPILSNIADMSGPQSPHPQSGTKTAQHLLMLGPGEDRRHVYQLLHFLPQTSASNQDIFVSGDVINLVLFHFTMNSFFVSFSPMTAQI